MAYANPEDRKRRDREYRAENVAKTNANQRAYRAAHPGMEAANRKRRRLELVDNPDDPRHGKPVAWKYGCRCDRCRAAHERDLADRKADALEVASEYRPVDAPRPEFYNVSLGQVIQTADRRRGTVVGFDFRHDRALVAFGENVRPVAYSSIEGGMR